MKKILRVGLLSSAAFILVINTAQEGEAFNVKGVPASVKYNRLACQDLKTALEAGKHKDFQKNCLRSVLGTMTGAHQNKSFENLYNLLPDTIRKKALLYFKKRHDNPHKSIEELRNETLDPKTQQTWADFGEEIETYIHGLYDAGVLKKGSLLDNISYNRFSCSSSFIRAVHAVMIKKLQTNCLKAALAQLNETKKANPEFQFVVSLLPEADVDLLRKAIEMRLGMRQSTPEEIHKTLVRVRENILGGRAIQHLHLKKGTYNRMSCNSFTKGIKALLNPANNPQCFKKIQANVDNPRRNAKFSFMYNKLTSEEKTALKNLLSQRISNKYKSEAIQDVVVIFRLLNKLESTKSARKSIMQGGRKGSMIFSDDKTGYFSFTARKCRSDLETALKSIFRSGTNKNCWSAALREANYVQKLEREGRDVNLKSEFQKDFSNLNPQARTLFVELLRSRLGMPAEKLVYADQSSLSPDAYITKLASDLHDQLRDPTNTMESFNLDMLFGDTEEGKAMPPRQSHHLPNHILDLHQALINFAPHKKMMEDHRSGKIRLTSKEAAQLEAQYDQALTNLMRVEKVVQQREGSSRKKYKQQFGIFPQLQQLTQVRNQLKGKDLRASEKSTLKAQQRRLENALEVLRDYYFYEGQSDKNISRHKRSPGYELPETKDNDNSGYFGDMFEEKEVETQDPFVEGFGLDALFDEESSNKQAKKKTMLEEFDEVFDYNPSSTSIKEKSDSKEDWSEFRPLFSSIDMENDDNKVEELSEEQKMQWIPVGPQDKKKPDTLEALKEQKRPFTKKMNPLHSKKKLEKGLNKFTQPNETYSEGFSVQENPSSFKQENISGKAAQEIRKKIGSLSSEQKLLSLQEAMKKSSESTTQKQSLKDALTKIQSKEMKNDLQKKLHNTMEGLKK